jgi:microcystin-dependent protein
MANLKVVEGVDSQTFKENIVPVVGTIMPFAGTVAPTGWILCNGSAFSEVDCPQLYALLGNTKVVPDLRNRDLLGGTTPVALQQTGGAVGHSHSATYALSGASNNASIDDGHGANYNGASYENAYHEHTGYYNSSIYGGSTFGNFVPGTQGNMTATDHSHNGGAYAVYYGSNPAHAHGFNAVVSNNTNPSHTHTFTASANQATVGSTATSTLPLTRYINFIIKAG